MLVGSRIQGPVGGTGEPLLTMKYVATDDKVNIGEKVVTSGMDKIFPRDIPVGTVQDVKPGTPFKQIWLKPAAKLERLEEVIVLLTQEPVEFAKEGEAPAATSNSSSTATAPANVSAAPASPPANGEKP
jgi:rod shape-determining protein MreC